MAAVAAEELTAALAAERGGSAAAEEAAATFLKQAKRCLFSLGNPRFLAAICGELKQQDKRGTGLLTASKFTDVLHKIGIAYGSPEADLIMRHCQVTDEGYVVYKELMLASSRATRKHMEDHARDTLYSDLLTKQDRLSTTFFATLPCKSEFSGFTPEVTEAVRRLYAQWERSCLRDWQLKAALKMLNLKLTHEFDQLLALQGPSGNVSFSQLMKALMINDPTSLRRHRQSKEFIPAVPEADRAPFYEPRRNILTWAEPDQRQQDCFTRTLLRSETENPTQTAPGESPACESLHQRTARLHSLVSLYLNQRLTANHFRRALVAANVTITPDIDLVIREQEADNSGHYTALLLAVLRAAKQI